MSVESSEPQLVGFLTLPLRFCLRRRLALLHRLDSSEPLLLGFLAAVPNAA